MNLDATRRKQFLTLAGALLVALLSLAYYLTQPVATFPANARVDKPSPQVANLDRRPATSSVDLTASAEKPLSEAADHGRRPATDSVDLTASSDKPLSETADHESWDDITSSTIESRPVPLVSVARQSDRSLQSQQPTHNETKPVPQFGQVTLPLAFVDPGPDMKLSASQVEAIGALRQQFVDAVGGYFHDPADPVYATQWQDARNMVDERMLLVVGIQGLMRLRDQAAFDAMQPYGR